MKARVLALPLVALALAVVPMACGRGESDVDTTPALESAEQPVRVTLVELGRAIAPDRRVTAATTEFATSDTIYASVVTEGTAPNATITARWTFEDGQVVDESTQTLSPTGTAVTEFHISKPDGWPTGRYRVEILLNGTSTQTKEFDVR
jgi:hypothetical protein